VGLTARWLHVDGLAALGRPAPADGVIQRWTPALYARLNVRFDHGSVVYEERVVHRLLLGDATAEALADLPDALEVALADDWLERVPGPGGRYAPLPAWLADQPSALAVQSAWRDEALRDQRGPPEAEVAETDDVTVLGVAVLWIPC
jgi:hypothetical protein